MVGVPGKSKGCNTCRQRKIACGLQRPACLQCVKSKRTCDYERNRVFVQVNPSSRNDASVRDVPDAKADKALVRSSNRQSMVATFVTQCLLSPQLTQPADKPWLILLLEMSMTTPALQTSSLALSIAALGRSYGDEALIHESVKMYVRGLSELQRALWRPRLVCQDETLAACLTLGLYELMECPGKGPQAYASHCSGLLSLIQHRGPYAYTSGLSHKLFQATRLQGVLYAMEQHCHTYLANPIWMQVPWTENEKNPMDRIVDCLAQAPDVLKDSARLPHLGLMDQLALANRIVSECWDLDWALQQCYEEIQASENGPLYWTVLSQGWNQANSPGAAELFPVSYQFPNIKTASSLMMYWASCIMLWTGLCELYGVIDQLIIVARAGEPSDGEYDAHGLPPLEHRTDFLSVARHLCRSVEYCLQKDMLAVGEICRLNALGHCHRVTEGHV